MDGLSSFFHNLFTFLVYYLEVGDVGLVVGVGNDVYVNFTGDMTILFSYFIFQVSAGFCYVRKVVPFFLTGSFVV